MEGNARNTCRLTGAVTGLLVFLALAVFGSVGWLAALVLGVVAGVILAAVLVWLVCEGTMATDGTEWAAALPATGSGMATVTAEADPAPLVAEAAMAAPVPVPAPAPVPDSDMAPSGDAQMSRAPVPLVEPESSIYGRREAPADDLTGIAGVGPKIAEALNEAGVTRFDQIAAWDDAAIVAMATRIKRGAGRIRRDDWVGQARRLVAENENVAG